jgi:hypothetical protein
MRPAPVTARTVGTPCSAARSEATSRTPAWSARSASLPDFTASMVATPVEQASALPWNVEVCTTPEVRRQAAMSESGATHAEMGKPPPSPLPRHRMSGATPTREHASIAPQRPSPVQISSPTSSASCSCAISERSGRNEDGGTTHPPRPRTGSTSTAPISPEASASRAASSEASSEAGSDGNGAKTTCGLSWPRNGVRKPALYPHADSAA